MKRYLAFDLGEKRIGLAVSDELGITAQRLPAMGKKADNEIFMFIQELIKKYEISALVVGLPRHMSGEVGKEGDASLKFARKLKQEFNLPVIAWDERLTTRYAEKTLIDLGLTRKKRRHIIDSVSAQLLLQSYLDSLLTPPTTP